MPSPKDSPKDPESPVRTTAPLAAALCACAIAIGLAACTGDGDAPPDDAAATSEAPSAEATVSESPSESPAVEETTAAPAPETPDATETTAAPSDDDGTDPGVEELAGAWTEDIPMMGSSFTVASDGFVVLTGEGGSFEGTILLVDTHRYQVELVSTAGGSPPAAMHWELEYDAAADTVLVYDIRDDGAVYEREFIRDA